MKIALPASGSMIFSHFGHCEDFLLFEVEGNEIVSETRIANPGHKPGFLPNFLADQGANVVIAGGMGGGAVDIFNERGVEVVLGAQGDARAAVNAWLAGDLKSTGSVCQHHDHEHGHHHE